MKKIKKEDKIEVPVKKSNNTLAVIIIIILILLIAVSILGYLAYTYLKSKPPEMNKTEGETPLIPNQTTTLPNQTSSANITTNQTQKTSQQGGGGGGSGGGGESGGEECTPKSCFELGFQCGNANDNCGNVINCGNCSEGFLCENNLCINETCKVTNVTYNFSCYNEDVYWFDNCGGLQSIKEDCISGCSGNSCIALICGNNICSAGENCPADVGSCVDNVCYEPTCTNGCSESLVSARSNDETCLLPNFCDGNGNCVECIDDGDCGGGESCIGGGCIIVSENTIYVDKKLIANCLTGTYSIANRDCSGSDGIAFNTIQEGVNNATPGYTVYIVGGDKGSNDSIYNVTCNGMSPIHSGTPENRITIRNFPGKYVLVHGTGAGGCDAIDMDGGGANYYTVKGIHFDNFNKGAEGDVSVRKEGWIIEDCEFSNFADRGLILRNVHDSIFRNLYIHHSYEAGFIGYTLCNNLTLINVESSYNYDGKGSEGDADGFAFGGNNGNITMINCTAINNGEDGLDVAGENFEIINFYASGGSACGIKLWRRANDFRSNYTLKNVIVKDFNEAGIKITADPVNAPAGDYNVQIYNSLFYRNGEEGLVFRQGRSDIHGKAEIYNTLFIHNGYFDPNDNTCCYPAYLVYEPIAPYWDIASDYNLFYDNWDGDVAWSGEGSNSIKAINPELFAPEIGDFHLKGNSLAIDAGKNIPGFNSDFNGQIRPIDGDSDGTAITDIGPFERSEAAGNHGPFFTYEGPVLFNVYENQELLIDFSASDPDGDGLRYLILGGDILPEMSIDNNGRFSFIPNNDRANSSNQRVYNIAIGVTDEHYYYPPSELNISITVNDVNRAPVYNGLGYYSFIEGRKGRIKLSIEDLDGETNIESVLTTSPPSLSYDTENFIVDWTPLSGDIGSYRVELNISDGVDIANYTITLEVLPLIPYVAPTDEAKIFYVNGASGNDNNDGQTLATAWKTIQKAKNTLTAGQMVLIRGGVYHEYGSTVNSGTPNAPIIYKAYPGEKVIMDGTGWSSPEAFNIYSSNLVIDGITFYNFSETLFVRGEYENITLVNINITSARDYGLQDWGIKNNLRVENVIIDGVGDRGLNLGSPANVHIYNVSIRDFADRGINIGGSDADNINIIDSQIFDSRSLGYFSILLAGKNAFIDRARIINTSGIAAYLLPDYAYMTNSIIAKTRFRGSESFGMLLGDGEGKPTEIELYNNVIYDSDRYGIYIRNKAKNKIRNCIIFDNAEELRGSTGYPLNEDYNIFGSGFTPVGSHSFVADPLFVDALNGDFHLQEDSLAIDAGIDLGEEFNLDIEGRTRPIDGDNNGSAEWDIGAYEYSEGIGGMGTSFPSQELPSKPSFSFISQIYNWIKRFLTGNTIKEITGYFLKIKA